MKHQIRITEEAERDILDIYNYVARTDSAQQAELLLERLEQCCLSLAQFPDRGHIPAELEDIAVKDFLEIHFKPYRIIYQLIDKIVFIHCIVDGRRDMQSLLERRVLR